MVARENKKKQITKTHCHNVIKLHSVNGITIKNNQSNIITRERLRMRQSITIIFAMKELSVMIVSYRSMLLYYNNIIHEHYKGCDSSSSYVTVIENYKNK